MSRFGRVVRLSTPILDRKVGYLGGVTIGQNYVGAATCKCGDTVTEVMYDPEKKSAKILTFDPQHREEDHLSEQLERMGIRSSVEVHERYKPLFASVLADCMPQSPSGRVQDMLAERYAPDSASESL